MWKALRSPLLLSSLGVAGGGGVGGGIQSIKGIYKSKLYEGGSLFLIRVKREVSGGEFRWQELKHSALVLQLK